MCFLRFLMQTRATLSRYIPEQTTTGSARKLHLVIGNETCDLDSAVSAVTLAFIYSQRQQEHDYVPVLNIPRIDYPLKTEVGHIFNKCDIKEEMLLFRDDLPEQLASDINVILVDHHVSQLAANVVEILDHRPMEQHQMMQVLPAHCEQQIEPEIGSCTTQVGERYLSEEEPRSNLVTQLLHATILLDTINFAPAAKRFCTRDLTMVQQLELLQQNSEDFDEDANRTRRHQIFDELVAARSDISKLTLTEVLRKDMKLVKTERHTVPMAGLPMLARDFIEKDDAENAIRHFAAGSNLLVILGMFVPGGGGRVQRDVALISLTGQMQLVERMRLALLESQSPPLQLKQYEVETNFLGGCYLRQHNIQATRKHILPIIKRALHELEASQHCDCDDVYFFKEKPKLGLS